jgi:flagellar M-ring protein FliF
MADPDTQSNDLKARFNELSERFSTGQMMLMGGAVLAVVCAVFLLSKASSTAEMTALYSGLKPTDAAAITEKLTTGGTSYTLADGGQTIMVPKEKVYDLRLTMAAANLPETTPDGYALLDKQGITTSEFSQQVGFQRAMEGELTKTISTMDAIESSTVHLAMPKDNVFASTDSKASASVLVKTKPGKTLDTMQVQAVVHLVASSVQGLTPEAVTVADSTGKVLAAPGVDGTDMAGADMNTKQRTSYEAGMAASLQAMLEPVVGAGKAKVTVSADIDYSKKNATSETFQQPGTDPTKATKATDSSKTETFIGPGSSDAGVLGPDGAPVVGAAAGGTTNYTLVQNDSKNALNRVVEQTTAPAGGVKRLSIAVLLDSNSSSADQVPQIQNLVTAAAGITPSRGDPVPQVSRLPFSTSQQDALAAETDAAKQAETKESTMGLLRQGAVVLFLLALLAMVYRSMRKAARNRPPGLWSGDIREITPVLPPGPVAIERAPIDLIEHEPMLELLSEEDMHRDNVTAQVEDMIDQQPVEVAQMLRGWLGDSKKAPKK